MKSIFSHSTPFSACSLILTVAILSIVACSDKKKDSPAQAGDTQRSQPATTTMQPSGIIDPTINTFQILRSFPHDRKAFTQGLVFSDGILYESTGQYGESSLRKVDISTGKVLKQATVEPRYFAEGLALLAGKLYQITWRSQTCFVYDAKTFKKEKELAYSGEGWGLTTDGKHLIMSDGSDQIRWIRPDDFTVERSLTVKLRGESLRNLNELELVNGELWANVWQTEQIVKIDTATGNVVGMIDVRGLLTTSEREGTDVLNGIAYNPSSKTMYITGKYWPKIFEIKVF